MVFGNEYRLVMQILINNEKNVVVTQKTGIDCLFWNSAGFAQINLESAGLQTEIMDRGGLSYDTSLTFNASL